MKKLFLLVAGLLLVDFGSTALAQRKIVTSGETVTENRNVSNFRGISVSSGIVVEFVEDASREVTVQADRNIIQYVVTEVNGGVLSIRYRFDRPNTIINGYAKTYVRVVAPEVVSLNASVSSVIKGEVNTAALSVNASNGSEVSLAGNVNSCVVGASSSSRVNLENMTVGYVKAKASSGASILCYATESFDAQTSSSADIVCRGSASQVKVNSSSSGSINGEVNGGTVLINTSSSGAVVLVGNAETCTVGASSGARVDLRRLTVKHVRANVSSSATFGCYVTESLQANATSGAQVSYRGPASRVAVNALSGATIKKSE